MKTFFGRNFYPAAAVLLVALVVVGSFLRVMVQDYLQDQTMESLTTDAQTVSQLASAYYTGGSLDSREFLVNLSVASQVAQADALICNQAGQVVVCSDAPLGCDHQSLKINGEYLAAVQEKGYLAYTGTISQLYDQERIFVSVPVVDSVTSSPVGMVMVSCPTQKTLGVIERISSIYLVVSLVVVAAAVIFMTIYARKQSKPLQELSRTANAFGHGDLNARVRLDGSYPQDVEDLALAFNNMASFLQKSEYQRQEFVANVSHELKTPMTTIGGYIDGILDGTIPPERAAHYMHIVSDETKRLSRLVRSMLDISQLQSESGIPEEKKSRFDLEECAGQVLITFEKKITDKDLNVQVDMPEYPVYTRANQDYITQVIYNLLDNAIKFCPPRGNLGLSIKTGTTKVYVSIANDGDTIPPQELSLVFDRFHKIDKSRSQNRDGWGLGLYIVKTIVCSHGEDISVSSRDGRTEFTFTLPLVN